MATHCHNTPGLPGETPSEIHDMQVLLRRKLLLALPVAGAAVAAPALARAEQPEPPAGETPIARLFAEWQRLHDHSNEPGISEEECNRRVEAELDLEAEIHRTPAITTQDLAQKMLIECGFGIFDPSARLWDEVCSLAGVPSSRMML